MLNGDLVSLWGALESGLQSALREYGGKKKAREFDAKTSEYFNNRMVDFYCIHQFKIMPLYVVIQLGPANLDIIVQPFIYVFFHP